MAIEENTSDSTNPLLDSTNPLYMHPSKNAGSMLVLVAFDGSGYRLWRRGVLRALSVKNKDLADSLQYVNDAKELWQELEDRYDQTNGARLYQLQKEINDLSQGAFDITGYYTKMKKLWEELNTLNAHAQCKCQCTCGAKASMQKAEQDRRLIQFLMGLNEVYTVVRGSILMMNPLPSLAQAFTILIQEEKQREMKPNNQLMIDPSALSANRAGNNNFRTSYGQQGNGSGGSSYTNYNQSSGTGSNSFRGNYPTNRPRPICDYRKKPGTPRISARNSMAPSLKKPLEIGKASDGLYYHISELCKNIAVLTQIPTQVSSSMPDKNNVHPHLHLVPPVASSLPVSYHACNKRCVDSYKHSSVNISPLSSKENAYVSNASTSVSTFTSTSDGNMVELLWHNRLGHVPLAKMKGINEILPNIHLHNLSFAPYAQWLDKADYLFQKEPLLQLKFLKYYMLICGDHITLQPMIDTSISLPL
ncbi:PREDICTED: uncharacterized protein LOC109206923 [Nicotiana attenuata]|uniref:uncharacterized protein LOC109206923 n=1 Tax=Nicotiana attenuata TaxID=49451 RepID=UPI0009047858|nr:PREDICTED: uncharacterized protein LOC109206923 [Nicotiana attenuata]